MRRLTRSLIVTLTMTVGLAGAACVYAGEKHHDHHDHKEHKHEKHDHDHGHKEHKHDHHDHDHEAHEQKAHVHGEAELMCVLEESLLECVLESPAMNIVGFEHKAKTEQHREIVNNAAAQLKAEKDLFKFAGTACQLTDSDIDVSGVLPSKHDHDHHDHHDHDKESSTHSDIEAHYRFSCNDGQALKSIDVGFTKTFSAIEKLNAQWVINGNQGAATLTPSNYRITIR